MLAGRVSTLLRGWSGPGLSSGLWPWELNEGGPRRKESEGKVGGSESQNSEATSNGEAKRRKREDFATFLAPSPGGLPTPSESYQ